MIKKLLFSTLFLAALGTMQAQTVNINPVNGNRGQSLPVVISGNNTSFRACSH